MQFDRVYAEIDLDNIRENMEAMRAALAPGTKMIGTVKTDGYGHGAVPVAKTIEPYVWGYAVASAEEAEELRAHGVEKPVLILGPVGGFRLRELIGADVRMTVFEYPSAQEISRMAVSLGKTARVHVAVDTGMSRIGLFADRGSAQTVKRISELPNLEIEGMFTHFARADETDKTAAAEQLAKFREFAEMVREAGVRIPLLHCSNSAAIIEMQEAHMDMVRAGISIYGLYPSDEVDRAAVKLKPAMALRAPVTYIKEIAPGTAVSYGGTFVAERPTRVATVGIGYGDGYPRNLSGKGYALIRGKRAPILGRVCMDQLMLDVTDIPQAREGDTATFLGRDGDLEITMEELAKLCGGFHYEIPCLISKRVPRVYRKDGRTAGTMTCFENRYEGF